MSHQDRHAGRVRTNSLCLLEALQWLMRGVNWSGVTLRDDCTWTPRWLAAGALLWAWSNEDTLAERFACSRRLIGHLRADDPPPAGSYQAFMKLLHRWTSRLVAALQLALRRRMQEFTDSWRLHGWVVFGVDGSRIDLPRTRSHEAAYAPSRKRSPKKRRARRRPRQTAGEKKAQQAQLWLTTMYHVALHLPWDWRIGPSDSSERAHALQMLDDLPAEALLTGDAGFVGYDFAQQVLASGRQLLVRVGSNVTLLKQLGYVRESAGTVYLWTDQAASRRDEPLVFRHVVAQGPRHPIHLIVSLLDPRRLSDRQVAELYRARWGVEVFYRHLKQTFGRRKLRSQAAANARVELEWSLVALWSIGLYASAQLVRRHIPLERLSMARCLRAFRRTARDYLHPCAPQDTLRQQLPHALIDDYDRKNKASRNYPRKKNESPAGPPRIKSATRTQIRSAQQLHATTQKG
jgi:hypothetical protein